MPVGIAARGLCLTWILAALLWLTPTIFAHAADTSIKIDASLNSDYVLVVRGNLKTVSGEPLQNARLGISVSGLRLGAVQTGGDGSFEFRKQLPNYLRNDNQPLVIWFPGDRNHSPSNATAFLKAASGDQQPPNDQPKTPAGPKNTTLQASTKNSDPVAGDVIEINGNLRSEGGSTANAEIQVSFNEEVRADSVAITEPTGNFKTFVAIPEGVSKGGATVTLRFPGNSKLKASSTSIGLSIGELPPLESDVEKAKKASQKPSAPATTAEPTPSASPSPTVKVNRNDNVRLVVTGPFTWALIALIFVGGFTFLVSGSLVVYNTDPKRSEPFPSDEALALFTYDTAGQGHLARFPLEELEPLDTYIAPRRAAIN